MCSIRIAVSSLSYPSHLLPAVSHGAAVYTDVQWPPARWDSLHAGRCCCSGMHGYAAWRPHLFLLLRVASHSFIHFFFFDDRSSPGCRTKSQKRPFTSTLGCTAPSAPPPSHSLPQPPRLHSAPFAVFSEGLFALTVQLALSTRRPFSPSVTRKEHTERRSLGICQRLGV